MHGLINNWEWYDYIQVEICIHGFNIFFFFAKKERTCTQHARILGVGGVSSRYSQFNTRIKHTYNKL